jgi:diguanylate cyclase (GGDEF)-like protein
MGGHGKALLIVAFVILAAVALFSAGVLSMPVFVSTALVAGVTAIAVAGAALAKNRRRSESRPQARVTPASAATTSRPEHAPVPIGLHAAEQPRHDAEANPKLVGFLQDLIAADTKDRVQSAVKLNLPAMLGARRVWVATQLRGPRQAIALESGEMIDRQLLMTDGQEWTTFQLRVEQDVIGVLGVESTGGLKPHAKHLIEIVTPAIAKALATVNTIETLREASLVDLLTGMATRGEGANRLRAELKRAQRTGASTAVLMLDLDRFKAINDRYGHATGDAVLTAVGRTLNKTLRASDSRSRWGGEEFLIVLPETDLKRAQAAAHGILRNIASTTVSTETGSVGTTVSIGLTIARPTEVDLHAIVRRADIALYRAKESGRACVRVVLGDLEGKPVGLGGSDPPKPSRPPLPFPDRRNPFRPDRRTVRSPGRRSTDPRPPSAQNAALPVDAAKRVDAQARTSLRWDASARREHPPHRHIL